MSEVFYQMTEAQLSKLKTICNSDTGVLVVALPLEGDGDLTKSVIADNMKMVDDLATLGLVEDSTAECIGLVDRLRKQLGDGASLTGRDLKVYTATKVGFMMFHEHSKPTIQ